MQFRNMPFSEEFDGDLLQRVTRFLHQKGYPPHLALEISIEQGVVVVQGRVPTFYLRQIAVECIKHVAGVARVIDLIKVEDRPGQPACDAPPHVRMVDARLFTDGGQHILHGGYLKTPGVRSSSDSPRSENR